LAFDQINAYFASLSINYSASGKIALISYQQFYHVIASISLNLGQPLASVVEADLQEIENHLIVLVFFFGLQIPGLSRHIPG